MINYSAVRQLFLFYWLIHNKLHMMLKNILEHDKSVPDVDANHLGEGCLKLSPHSAAPELSNPCDSP